MMQSLVTNSSFELSCLTKRKHITKSHENMAKSLGYKSCKQKVNVFKWMKVVVEMICPPKQFNGLFSEALAVNLDFSLLKSYFHSTPSSFLHTRRRTNLWIYVCLFVKHQTMNFCASPFVPSESTWALSFQEFILIFHWDCFWFDFLKCYLECHKMLRYLQKTAHMTSLERKLVLQLSSKIIATMRCEATNSSPRGEMQWMVMVMVIMLLQLYHWPCDEIENLIFLT